MNVESIDKIKKMVMFMIDIQSILYMNNNQS